MLKHSEAFSGFAVNDTEAAKRFYGETLGLEVTEVDPEYGLLQIEIRGSRAILVYGKADHEPAGYTILNFPVSEIEPAVAALTERGVEFERYVGTEMATDEQGIFRGGGPLIAWFKDPAGNVLSLIEQ